MSGKPGKLDCQKRTGEKKESVCETNGGLRRRQGAGQKREQRRVNESATRQRNDQQRSEGAQEQRDNVEAAEELLREEATRQENETSPARRLADRANGGSLLAQEHAATTQRLRSTEYP